MCDLPLPQDNFQRAKGQLCYLVAGEGEAHYALVVLVLTLLKLPKLENKEKFFYKQNWKKCKFDIYSIDLSVFDTLCMRKTILDIIICYGGGDVYCCLNCALCQYKNDSSYLKKKETFDVSVTALWAD